MNEWNFRLGFRGCLVLQRLIRWKHDGHDMQEWVDAKAPDLKDYYAALARAGGKT